MHVLVIGIDRYSLLSPGQQLRGAVADAQAYASFFERKHHAPVRRLLDEQATYDAILGEFNWLINNEDIPYNDPIVIVFAGHGTSFLRPDDWDEDMWNDRIDAIVPSDFDPSRGRAARLLLDRQVSALLSKLANKKGNNIVSFLLKFNLLLVTVN